MVLISLNHLEILSIYECVWLMSMIQHIQKSCGLSSIKDNATKWHEDNTTCFAQIKGRFIKFDKTK